MNTQIVEFKLKQTVTIHDSCYFVDTNEKCKLFEFSEYILSESTIQLEGNFQVKLPRHSTHISTESFHVSIIAE